MIARFCFVFVFLFFLSGCSGIAHGVTKAILEKKGEAKNQCRIMGKPLKGIGDSLADQETHKGKNTKIVMVHGISPHLPGYSTRMREGLTTALGLDMMTEKYKEILIQRPDILRPDGKPENLGILRITRHMNQARTHEILFYELTWSQISDPARAALAFDNSGSAAFERTPVNHTTKVFFNNTIPDLMAYRGIDQMKINYAVGQAICWSFAGGWDDLPTKGAHFCNSENKKIIPSLQKDDFFFITHSLGSRITVDTIARASENPNTKTIRKSLKDKDITVFMMSNQLPLLEIGQKKPSVTGKIKEYCIQDAPLYSQRTFRHLNLIAFSDPNDILSYGIPPEYVDESLDSRLCPNVVNVSLNVAPVQELFGVSFANPAVAHGGYDADSRVVDIMTHGISRDNKNSLVERECRWTQTLE